MAEQMGAYMPGKICDMCETRDFKHRQYACLTCEDFYLCGQCHDANLPYMDHTTSHSMQLIIMPGDKSTFFKTDKPDEMDRWESYACPACKNLGMTLMELKKHWDEAHGNYDQTERSCPVCLCTHYRPTYFMGGFGDHLNGHIQADQVEWSSDFRPNPTAGQSMRRRTGGRGHGLPLRRAVAQPPGHLATGEPPFGGNYSSDDDDYITALLNQLTAQRANNPTYQRLAEPLTAARASRAAAQTNIPADDILRMMRAGRAVRDGFGDRRGFGGSFGAPASVAWNSETTMNRTYSVGTASESTSAASIEVPATLLESTANTAASNDDRELMQSLFNKPLSEEAQAAVDVERANRAMFVEELFLSTLIVEDSNAQETERRPTTAAKGKKKKAKPSNDAGAGDADTSTNAAIGETDISDSVIGNGDAVEN